MKYLFLGIIIALLLALLCSVGQRLLAEKESIQHSMHEYQIELEFDTVLIYQRNRFVGSYIIGNVLSPIDSILALDNQ